VEPELAILGSDSSFRHAKIFAAPLAPTFKKFLVEIDRHISQADISADIWVLPIYLYRPKRPILSASVGVDKTLLYS